MTWAGESLPRDQLRPVTLPDEEAGELDDAVLRISGQVCAVCDAPTPLLILQVHGGRCAWCVGDDEP